MVEVLEVGGCRLNVERIGAGPPGAATIVLLHEGLGSIRAWGSFPAALAAATQREVVVYDRRGYGSSGPWPGPWPARFLQDEAADVLAPLLVQLQIERPLLVGHSDGASIALAYPAVRPPEAPQPVAIVSLSAHVLVEDVSVASITALRGAGRDALVARLGRHHDRADEVFEAWSEVWTSDRFRGWTLDDELASVRCPVVAVQGAEDRFGTRLQLERLAVTVVGPVEVHELDGVDHWPHRDATEVVLALVTELRRRVDP